MRKQNSNKRIERERERERDEQCTDTLRIWRVKLQKHLKPFYIYTIPSLFLEILLKNEPLVS